MSQTRYRVWPDGSTTIDFMAAAIAPKTYTGYSREVLSFLDWTVLHNIHIDSVEALDGPLHRYMHTLAFRSKVACSRLLSGISHFFPEARGHLPRSALTLRGIMRVFPGRPFTPITREATALIAFYQSVRYGFAYAVATLLSFDCLLRVNECLSLTTEDVVDYRDPRLSSLNKTMVLRLRKTKTGPLQSVIVESSHVERLLRVLVRSTARGARLFHFSADKFRRTIRDAANVYRIDATITPHCFRDGGATLHWIVHRDQPALKMRGRWRDDRSLLRYVQVAEMLMLNSHIPPRNYQFAVIICSSIYWWMTRTLYAPSK